jgi:hypothetical protein
MTYVPKFDFVAIVRFGSFPDRLTAELEAAKKFGRLVVRVQSEADYREERDETTSLRRRRSAS